MTMRGAFLEWEQQCEDCNREWKVLFVEKIIKVIVTRHAAVSYINNMDESLKSNV